MTVLEALSFNKELLKRLALMGLKPDDCKYIDLYSEYERLCKNGEKVTYIVSFLASKYAVSERKVYMIIKQFSSNCTIGAVE